jgi:ribonuclease HI
MPWLRHRLRDADVWARVDASSALVKDADGRVEIVYAATPGAKVYRAGARNLTPAAGSEPIEIDAGAPAEKKPVGARGAPVAAVPADAIHVWTDGACSGNPGPAGLGVVVIGDGPKEREISEYLGQGTNNIAELTAILRGLEAVSDPRRPVVVYSDSAYSIGLLAQNWKAKKNVELVAELREVCKRFAKLQFVKVLGHSGIALNERVDQLATGAITRRASFDRLV